MSEIIADEIRKRGPIPFARFMELALYCPVYGYYEKEADNLGRRGDFFTSVSVGGLFGELLAFRFADWLAEVQPRTPVPKIVEAGAHTGQLAGDILSWLRSRRPELFRDLEYWIVEPSERRQKWQAETLAEFATKTRWVGRITDLAVSGSGNEFCGVIVSNELLDAMPVHRLGWDAKSQRWFEWGVALKDGDFGWSVLSPETNAGFSTAGPRLPELPESLLNALPDRYTIELSPAAGKWWNDAANVLERGKLLTIDYGLTSDDLLLPERSRGTLRAYHRHRIGDDVLANPGEQDITVHVNFTELKKAGEVAGLRTEKFISQEEFLTRILEDVSRVGQGEVQWNSGRARQFQTLTHPDHLGRRFKVLLQSR